MEWAYGVTTVASRFGDLLPRTLASLAAGGFPSPRLFVDGPGTPPSGYEVTQRIPALRTFGNWLASLHELWLRHAPNEAVERFAIFQDDFVCVRNMRQYLETVAMPQKGYMNLYTFPHNDSRIRDKPAGFYASNQRGLGAVALVFDRAGVRTILGANHMHKRPETHDPKRPSHKFVDGAIVESFRKAGWREFVHAPSLVQHTGRRSSMGNGTQPLAPSFPGEDFDAMTLASQPPALVVRQRRVAPVRTVGLAGFNAKDKTGARNRAIAENSEVVSKWVIRPSGPAGPRPEDVDVMFCPSGAKVPQWLATIDAVVFLGEPPYPRLAELANKAGKRVVCLWFFERRPGPWAEWVDLFLVAQPQPGLPYVVQTMPTTPEGWQRFDQLVKGDT